MALLFFDGFDHYGNTTNITVTSGKWGAQGGSGAGTPQTTNPRTGTHALSMNGNLISCTTKTFTPSGGCIVGLAYRPNSYSTVDIVQILETSTVHIALAITAGGLLTVKLGATVIATGTTPLLLNTYYYLELKAVIADSGGSYEVRIDNLPEAALTATGVDTRNGGTGLWNRVLIGGGNTTAPNQIDDFYLCDTSGSAPRNNFLGPVKVETIFPQTDAVAAGSNAGLTPSTGTDHGALVDETAPNTTDFNGSPTVGLKDTYNYPPMTITGTVLGVQTNLYVNKSDSTSRQVCPVVRTAGVDTDGANITLTTSFFYYSQVWQQNPNAGSPIEWTTTDVANMQAGMKVTL